MSEIKVFEIGQQVRERMPSTVLLERELQNTIETSYEKSSLN